MGTRQTQFKTRLNDHEVRLLERASKRRGVTPARFVRESAVAAATGHVMPAEWFSQSMEMAKDLYEMLEGMREFCPEEWEQILDDRMHALTEEFEGFDPKETSG